jgi:hypothetical protein
MTKPVTTDPRTLVNIISGLGGTVIPGPTFRFELPRSEVKTVIPKINELGIACRNVGERVEDDPVRLRCSRSVVTIELYKGDDEERRFQMPKW